MLKLLHPAADLRPFSTELASMSIFIATRGFDEPADDQARTYQSEHVRPVLYPRATYEVNNTGAVLLKDVLGNNESSCKRPVM
jgi:hypothetical protein